LNDNNNNKKQGADGTYAKVVPSAQTVNRIAKIADMLNIPELVSPTAMHTTVVYSRVVCEGISSLTPQAPITATPIGFTLFDTDGDTALVLVLDSPGLHELHNICRDKFGATHDYPTYTPHLTLTYNYPDIDLPSNDMLQYFGIIEFDQYIVEPLDFEWKE